MAGICLLDPDTRRPEGNPLINSIPVQQNFTGGGFRANHTRNLAARFLQADRQPLPACFFYLAGIPCCHRLPIGCSFQ